MFGQFIKGERLAKGIGLREFCRRLDFWFEALCFSAIARFGIPIYFIMPKVLSGMSPGHWFSQLTHFGMLVQRPGLVDQYLFGLLNQTLEVSPGS